MRSIASGVVVLTLATSAIAAAPRPGSFRMDARGSAPYVAPTDTITPSIPEQIALINFVWKERRWIVGDGAFIDAYSLFKRTGVPIYNDGRWSESVRDLLWGGAMPHDQQPARPPLMRLWEVTRVVRIGEDRAQVEAIVRNSPLHHYEQIKLWNAGDRWVVTSLEIVGFGYP